MIVTKVEEDFSNKKTMPEEKKENKVSDQIKPSPSAAASPSQKAAYSMLTLASGSNAIIGDIANGNVAAKPVQVEAFDASVSKAEEFPTLRLPTIPFRLYQFRTPRQRSVPVLQSVPMS